MHSENTSQHSASRWLPWIYSALGLAGGILFIVLYPPANELAWETGKIVFTLFFTPFILEAICIILGILIVITINNRRLAKEAGDEWVFLHQVDPETAETVAIPEVLKRRIEDAPFVSRPTPAGAAERIAEISGYLDLGMAEEAASALFEVPESEVDTHPFLLQRIRLANLRGDRDKIDTLCAAALSAGATHAEIESANSGFAG